MIRGGSILTLLLWPGLLMAQTPLTDFSTKNLPVLDLITNSMDVEPVDVDGDGDPDLVIASEFAQNLILINNGKGKFTNETAERLPKAAHDSEDIAAEDFDGDGDVDLVFVSEDDQENEYYLNDGKGYFTASPHPLPVKGTTNGVAALDADGDGDMDIVLGNAGQNYLLVNDGKGKFTHEPDRLPQINDATQDVEVGDVDGDGDPDLVFGNEDDNRLLLNDGRGNFTDAPLPLEEGETEETREADLTDIDGDGDLDLFFANVKFIPAKDPKNRILINDGKGNFTDETTDRFRGANLYHTADADFYDLDGDGDPDLILANAFGHPHQVLINENGIFTDKSREILPANAGTGGIDVEAADFDGDGLPDLYFGVFRDADRLFLSAKNNNEK